MSFQSSSSSVATGADTTVPTLDRNRVEVTAEGGAWELIGGRCTSCGRLTVPPRFACPSCWGRVERQPLRKTGRVRSWTINHTKRPDVALEVPYSVLLVELADGPAITIPSLDVDPFELDETVVIEALAVDTSEGRRLGIQAVRGERR